jgi:nucleoid-associated protein YgaU
MMIASKAAIAACSFGLVAVGGTAILVGSNGLWQAVQTGPRAEVQAGAEGKARNDGGVETRPAPLASLPPAAAAPPSAPPLTRNDISTALGEAKNALADLPAPTASAPPEDSGPRFDVARVDEDGEAVIAGRGAPGARIDLLRDGETHASAVADASGLFVMTPPKLPPGNYKLTLKSTAPDGSVAQSKGDVPVTLKAAAAPPRVAPARADVAKTEAKAAEKPESPATAQAASHQAAPRVALALAATPAEKGPLRAKPETTGSIGTSRIVTRGDSLWLISRRAYGDGTSYALIYNANRGKIHDPDRIYPGQTFVVPRKER